MQQRAEQTREKILLAAADLLAEQGPADFGTAPLFRRAGITQGAFYFHFKDKAAIVAPLQERAAATVQRRSAYWAKQSDPLQQLLGFWTELGRIFGADPFMRASFRFSIEGGTEFQDVVVPVFAQWRRILTSQLSRLSRLGLAAHKTPMLPVSEAVEALLNALIGAFLLALVEGKLPELATTVTNTIWTIWTGTVLIASEDE